MVSVTFDPKSKALYTKLIEGEKPMETVPLWQGKYMDVSKHGKAIGLEIIFPSSTPKEAINAILESKEVIKLLTH
ncbi:MAG: hypothetical protein ACPKPY_04925 [Nitrososphaeraceae archaeon]